QRERVADAPFRAVAAPPREDLAGMDERQRRREHAAVVAHGEQPRGGFALAVVAPEQAARDLDRQRAVPGPGARLEAVERDRGLERLRLLGETQPLAARALEVLARAALPPAPRPLAAVAALEQGRHEPKRLPVR